MGYSARGLLSLVVCGAGAACAGVPEASRAVAWELTPEARTTVTVEGQRFAVLLFRDVYVENGDCLDDGACVTYSAEPDVTEVYALSEPALSVADEELARAAGFLARCPGADVFEPDPDLANDLDQTGFLDGIWSFDSLCPQDREAEGN